MKKLASALCVLMLAAVAVLGGTMTAFAASATDVGESDAALYQALEMALDEQGITDETIAIQKQTVYDLSLNPLGFVYGLQAGEKSGYAISVNTSGTFDVTELFLQADNPYEGCSGVKVYVGPFVYLEYSDGVYADARTGATLNEAGLELLKTQALYCGDSRLTAESQTIYYTNKTENKYNMVMRHPAYFLPNQNTSCVAITGANLIGYYDRFHTELIPNFTPGTAVGSYYLYKTQPAEGGPVINTLATYMGTTDGVSGATITQFRNAMSKYCGQKGLSISFASCMQNGALNYSLIKQRIESGLPAAVFVDSFTVETIAEGNNYDSLSLLVSQVPHTLAAFGYNEITYTLSGGGTRTDRYLAVATGFKDMPSGYFNVGYRTQIDEAYSINIY